MGYRNQKFVPGNIYHIFARGVEQRTIFLDFSDYSRFLALFHHCIPETAITSYSIAKRLKTNMPLSKSGEGLVDILCYCLMSNHFHLLLKENKEQGISKYIQRLLNSYARYFNVKYKRQGALFSGPFKAVNIDNDDQLLHVSRYIHLNPYVAHIDKETFDYPWSSLAEYIKEKSDSQICHADLIQEMMSAKEYKKFVTDHANFARSLADINHLTID